MSTTAPAPLTRRDREQLRHRHEILSAAEKVFAQKGFHLTTMEDIAMASEFAIGSLYKHFKNKDDIFRSILEDRFTAYMDLLDAQLPLEGRPFTETFDWFLEHHADFSNANLAFFRLFYSCQVSSEWQKEDLQSSLRPRMERYHVFLRALMRHGMQEGVLEPADPGDLAAFMLGTLHGFFFHMLKEGHVPDFRQKLPVIRSFLLKGAMRRSGDPVEPCLSTSALPENGHSKE